MTTETVSTEITQANRDALKRYEQTALAMLAEGTSLADILEDLFTKTSAVEVHPPEPVPVLAITDDQRKALREIVSVYGVVAPTKPVILTDSELATLVHEREIIDTILPFLTSRKDKSIREAFANHFDRLVEEDWSDEGQEAEIPTDRHGHYAVKQEQPVPGTARKVQRLVSGGKPKIGSVEIQVAYERGDLSHDEYLAVTTKPEVKRDFDEAKARAAIKKDPALAVKLAGLMKASPPTTTIKVVKQS